MHTATNFPEHDLESLANTQDLSAVRPGGFGLLSQAK